MVEKARSVVKRESSGMNEANRDETAEPSLRSIAGLFLMLGTTSFGGPAAHIGMLENEVVRRRRWVDSSTFLDLLSATNLIPGPNSTEMAIHLGHKLRGWKGLIVAGAAFIAPATAIVMLLSWVYVSYGTVPAIHGMLYGIRPVLIGIVAQALWTLGRSCLRTRSLAVLCAMDLLAIYLDIHELAVLFGTGIIAAFIQRASHRPPQGTLASLALPIALSVPSIPLDAPPSHPFSLSGLFFVFLKIGSVLFGSGYVLLAYLNSDFVVRLGWLSQQQLLDAVTIGQITPGPLFTSATFVGYVMAGPIGGIVATIGIFLPSFVFVALSAPVIPLMRRSPTASAFLDGINVASWALMASVMLEISRQSIVDLPTLILAGIGLIAIVYWKINSTWLVLAGAVSGIAYTFLA
jgi:chromate transporter